ncbi:ATP-binding protein [Streptomyces sp. NBC_01795]|nr:MULTISPECIES: ATP-binding protein [unclassified Streptomyces]WSA93729.1 ATP-binding protein [Streptomyces sp. NBC_01795]WSB78101.1 ATP-binding protein [Streptomyces sp. NBC_01775]WSS13647.1 ATP-binding protein [Streptomyces sp. NBC_01186]WSS42442.1 ATP-binding protein [Streptomyces sp. NBC_01187]
MHSRGAFIRWRGAKEVSGVALVVAQEVPTSSTMAVPHGPSAVGIARRRMREELLAGGAPDAVIDDAILILSELLSNACRHARPLSAGFTRSNGTNRANVTNGNSDSADSASATDTADAAHTANSAGVVEAAWHRDARGELTISVTDGGGPTRPLPATPSVTARGGRGLAIITALARDWGVSTEREGHRGGSGTEGVTVWAVLPPSGSFSGRVAASLDLGLASLEELG